MEKRTVMDKELKQKLDNLRNDCGHEGTFRMVIGYLFDKGYDTVSSITKEDIDTLIKECQIEEEKIRAQGKCSLITPEFQGFIVEMAVKFTEVATLFQLLKYIANEMFLA